MKNLFITKYLGKTILIVAAVEAMGMQAHAPLGFDIGVIAGATMYCFGSIAYQFKLRDKKKTKFQYK